MTHSIRCQVFFLAFRKKERRKAAGLRGPACGGQAPPCACILRAEANSLASMGELLRRGGRPPLGPWEGTLRRPFYPAPPPLFLKIRKKQTPKNPPDKPT